MHVRISAENEERVISELIIPVEVPQRPAELDQVAVVEFVRHLNANEAELETLLMSPELSVSTSRRVLDWAAEEAMTWRT